MEFDFVDKNHYRLYPFSLDSIEQLDEATVVSSGFMQLIIDAAFTVSSGDVSYRAVHGNSEAIVSKEFYYPKVTLVSVADIGTSFVLRFSLTDVSDGFAIAEFTIPVLKTLSDGALVSLSSDAVSLSGNIINLSDRSYIITGYIVVGDLSKVVSALVTRIHNVALLLTKVTCMRGHYVESLQLINRNRNRIERTGGTPAYVSQAYLPFWTTLDVSSGMIADYGSSPYVISKGVLTLVPGFNCNLTVDSSTNTLSILPSINGGLGKSTRDVPLGYYFDSTTNKYCLESCLLNNGSASFGGTYYFYNGVEMRDTVKSISGTSESSLVLDTPGISVTYAPELSTIYFSINKTSTKCSANVD